MIKIPEYWQAIARGIDAEEQKASILIRHNASVGAAREAILRDVLVKQTPVPYRVASGFVFVDQPQEWCSKQCDVLVYDPTVAQPYYSIGDLCVVARWSAKLVSEVKSRLDQEAWSELLGIWSDTSWVPVPTLGFAYDGVTFDTFLNYLKTTIRDEDKGVPTLVAVHGRNYLFLRSEYRLAPDESRPKRHRPAVFQIAVNFGEIERYSGWASATFLDFYLRFLRGWIPETEITRWFNDLGLPDSSLASFSDDGEVTFGKLNLPAT